jgi:hypothetical protein
MHVSYFLIVGKPQTIILKHHTHDFHFNPKKNYRDKYGGITKQGSSKNNAIQSSYLNS